MKLIENIFLIQRMDQLIRLKATGTPTQLGDKLGLSERQVRRIIEEFKGIGIPVEYCKKQQTYHYRDSVFVKFEIAVIKNNERQRIVGGEGTNKNIFNYFFSDGHFMSAPACTFVPS